MSKSEPPAFRWVDPLSRPVLAATIPATGIDIHVEPTPAEREAMARALDLAAVDSLTARYRLRAAAGGIVEVTGEVTGQVQPRCIVTLEAFPLAIAEPVALRFIDAAATAARRAHTAAIEEVDHDPPDPIENGAIDLGHVTTEFLSLALPPYPRKPGAAFDTEATDEAANPFAALRKVIDKT